jgi:hypothetical protein
MLRSPESFQDAALGGLIGAVLGLVLVAALVVFNLGLGRDADDNAELLPWLALMAFVVVSQFAMAGGLYGLTVSDPPEAR